MVKLTRADVWIMIEKSGLAYIDWPAKKEINRKESVMHIYVDPQAQEKNTVEQARLTIRKALVESNEGFSDTTKMLGPRSCKCPIYHRVLSIDIFKRSDRQELIWRI